MINACKSQNINSVWPVWLTKTYSKKTASLNHSMLYTNFYTPVQLYSNQKHKHTTHLWSVWFKRKKNSKTHDQKWKKEKQRHILLRNVRSFPPIFEFKNIHYLFASVAEKGKLFERITDRYCKLRKKKRFWDYFFWWKEKSEVFLYDFVWERRESKECREKEQQLQLRAGRMCYKEKRYTLDIVLDRQRQS